MPQTCLLWLVAHSSHPVPPKCTHSLHIVLACVKRAVVFVLWQAHLQLPPLTDKTEK